VLHLSCVAADDSVGRPGVVEGRLSQGQENHGDHIRRRQEHLGDHRDDGSVETDRERHVTFLVIFLGGDDDEDDGNGAADSRYIRHDDAEAASLVNDNHGDSDGDGDDNDIICVAVANVIHGESSDLPCSTGWLESHLHHRDIAEDNLAYSTYRSHGVVIEKISGFCNRRSRRCHDQCAFDGQGDAGIARKD